MAGFRRMTVALEDDPCTLLGTPCIVVPAICQALSSKQQCICSNISYLLAAACDACATLNASSWDEYASENACGDGGPQQFPSSLLLTTTEVVPTWAVEMALATPTPTTFNLADASALALAGISTTRVSFVGSKSQPIPSSTRVGSSSERSNPTSTSASSVGSATPTKTELTHPVPAHRNMLPTAAIIGIVLGTCFIVLSLAILLVLLRRRRRRQQQADFAANPYPVASSHTVASIPRNGNAPDNSDTRSITTVRRQYLRNELRAAQEKIVNIEESETRTISMRATQSSTPGRLLRLISTRSASSTGSGLRGVVSELRDRNEALTARIRELEAQMESPWALGLSNDPPPGYSEEGP